MTTAVATSERWLTEEQFGLIADSVLDYGMYLLSPNGIVETWNTGAERLNGYKRGEIIGQHFSVFYPPADKGQGKPEKELLVAAEEGSMEEVGWRVRKDGTLFLAKNITTALRAPDGGLVGFVKVTRDLSEHRQAEEFLRQSQESFRLLVDSVQDYAIFMLDTTGRIVSWNEGARRIKQYSPSEIMGQHFSIFYPPEDVARHKPDMELKIAIRDGRFEEEGWRVRKDGSRIWANVVISAIYAPEGWLLGFSKVTRDLTERRRVEELQRQAHANLSRSNQELDEYAAFVSHDLQEPLRKMASYAELVSVTQGDRLDEKGKSQLAVIVDAAKRMRTLIVELLDYSRVGRAEPPMTRVALDGVVRTVQEDLALALTESSGTVTVGPLPHVNGNIERLRSVFGNLLSNAIKYRDLSRPLEIRIDAERREAEWIIAVRDNGIGFDQQYVEQVLHPFERLHPKEKYPGTGLGLALCKKIITLHGGRIWAHSEEGEGSEFFLSLPVESPR